jgi:hypothetical protein
LKSRLAIARAITLAIFTCSTHSIHPPSNRSRENCTTLAHTRRRIPLEATMKFFFICFLVLLTPAVSTRSGTNSAAPAARVPQNAAPSAFQLENKSFEFPGAGQRNNNDTIGDFCCTGETATIRTAQGSPAGYIYFYGFSGGITNGKRSAAKRFNVLVSGLSDPAQPASAHVKSSIDFAADKMKPGLTRKTIAGVLEFTVTIQDVQFLDEAHSRFFMDSIKIKVDVQEAPRAQSSAPLPDADVELLSAVL